MIRIGAFRLLEVCSCHFHFSESICCDKMDFARAIADLESGLTNIDTIFNSKKTIQFRNELSSWNDDKKLTTSISNLKKATDITSDSLTKLTLVSI